MPSNRSANYSENKPLFAEIWDGLPKPTTRIQKLKTIATDLKTAAEAERVSYYTKFERYLEQYMCYMYYILLLIASRILLIVVGIMNEAECPANMYIPLFLIAYGSYGLLHLILSVTKSCVVKCYPDNDQPAILLDCMACVIYCIRPMAFLIFLCGNIVVFTTYDSFSDYYADDDYCDPITYWLAFWIIMFDYIHITIYMMMVCGCYILSA